SSSFFSSSLGGAASFFSCLAAAGGAAGATGLAGASLFGAIADFLLDPSVGLVGDFLEPQNSMPHAIVKVTTTRGEKRSNVDILADDPALVILVGRMNGEWEEKEKNE
ncbi:hypothetical protein PMAYCL1PPCAC_24243, partial [Pristionchus mayeri]